QAKEAEEEQRQAAIDAMMKNPECDEEDEEVDEAPEKGFKPPKRGAKPKEDEPSDAMREELRRQREERLAARQLEREAGKAKPASKDLAAVLEKVANEGEGKLSNKERRVYAKHLEKQREESEEQERAPTIGGAKL
ncbi:unnamed protein product, partial [Effrenium voratum]